MPRLASSMRGVNIAMQLYFPANPKSEMGYVKTVFYANDD